MARRLLIFPVPVRLNRLAAPLFVLIFGISLSIPCLLMVDGRHHHDHGASFHLGRRFDRRVTYKELHQFLQDHLPPVGMNDLPPPKPDRHLDFVAFLKEPPGMLGLGLEVVVIGFGTDLKLLDLDDFLFFLGLLCFFCLLYTSPSPRD